VLAHEISFHGIGKTVHMCELAAKLESKAIPDPDEEKPDDEPQ
jgi:hypothetical protein